MSGRKEACWVCSCTSISGFALYPARPVRLYFSAVSPWVSRAIHILTIGLVVAYCSQHHFRLSVGVQRQTHFHHLCWATSDGLDRLLRTSYNNFCLEQ